MTTHLYLIRHGADIEERIDGITQDLGLSPQGIQQITSLRDRLLRTKEIQPDLLISSPLPRALASAEILAPALGTSITTDPDFQEWICEDGTMTPETFTDLWNGVPEHQRPFFRFMDGHENSLEFSGRIHMALNRVIQAHEGKTIVIITHGGVIGTSFKYFFGLSSATTSPVSIAAQHASITHWLKPTDQTRWTLERFNDYQP